MLNANSLIQDRYQIERVLGTGGFGRVYLAHDQRLGRRVAVKELLATRLDDDEQQQALTLFEREARMLAQLDHPGLTSIWDYFQHDGRAYLVMEYIPGPTMRELVVRHGGPLPEPTVIAYALQLCAVLRYLHSQTPPIIFRDLKPSNVIVEEHTGDSDSVESSFTLKLIDFGIARLFKPDQSADTMIIGTPGYAAPEQYGHGQTDHRSDIYSLGATLHHLASGQPPAGLILSPLLEVNPALSPALARVIARATAITPDDRYQSVDAVVRDLQALAAGGQGATSVPLAPRRTVPLAPGVRAPVPTSSPVLIVAIMVILVAVIGGGLLIANALGRESRSATSATANTVPNSAPTSLTASMLLPGASGQLLYGQYSENVLTCDIYLADMVSQSRRRLVGGANNTAAALSPDRKQIAVVKNFVLTVGPLSNPMQRQVSSTGRFARYPAFSPDGQSLAYTESSAANGAFRLAVFNLQTGEIRYPGPTRLGWVTWHSRGLTYAAPSTPGQPQDIFLLATTEAAPQNITDTPAIDEDFPAWSADGRTLFFTASTPGNLDSRQIYRANADGSQRRQLTQTAGPHTNPAPSPDGAWVAYVSRATGGRFQLWAMRTDGSEPHQILSGDTGQFYLRWEK